LAAIGDLIRVANAGCYLDLRMRILLYVWLVLLGSVAVLVALVIGQRTGWRSWQQNEAGLSEQGQSESTAEAAPSESLAASAAEPSGSRESQGVVFPRLDQTSTVGEQAARVAAAAPDNPTPPQTQTVAQPAPDGFSSQNPEPMAEIWSYPPLLQQNAATNFLRAMQKLTNATSEFERYLALDTAAKCAFVLGKTEDARNYATESLSLDQKFKDEPWRGGDSVHNGNLVLGRIAAREGQVEESKQYLLEAGKTTGSPVLGSFGPNMSLARDLLQNGGR